MSKSGQITKLINGEIADADIVNQIVEDAGAEGGLLPYDPDTEELSTNGSQSVGSTAYPFGSIKVNKDAELVEVDISDHSVHDSIPFTDLRRFIKQKDTPASYSGQGGKIVAVNSGESELEFINPPTKSVTLFEWHGNIDMLSANNYGLYVYNDINPSNFTGHETYQFLAVKGTTYRTVFKTKFKKTAGVSTVTVYFYGEGSYQSSGNEYSWKCTIGTASGGLYDDVQTALGWHSFTIDVSSLTDNAIYDVAFQMKTDSAATWAMTGDIIAFGS